MSTLRISRDTPTHVHGFTVFAECLAVGLVCGDQRRLMGSGSTLEVLRDDALQIHVLHFLLFLLYLSKLLKHIK